MKNTIKLISLMIVFILCVTFVSAQTINELNWNDIPTQTFTINEGDSAELYFMSAGVLTSDYPIYVTLGIREVGIQSWTYLTSNSVVLNEAEFNSAIDGTIDLLYLDLESGIYEIKLFSEDDNGHAGSELNLYLEVSDITNPNNAPTFSGAIPNQIIDDGEAFVDINLNSYFADIDASDVLTFTANNNLFDIEITNGVATINYSQIGSELVTFTACDLSNDCINSNVVNFTVNEVVIINDNILSISQNFNEITMPIAEEVAINLYENTIYTNVDGNSLDLSTLNYSIVSGDCEGILYFEFDGEELTVSSSNVIDSCAFQIYVEETVYAGAQQTAISNVIETSVQSNTFNLTNFECLYDPVPIGGTQVCYATFENQNNLPVQDAVVSFFYLNQVGQAIGNCTTNEVGYCDIAFTVLSQVGEYEVYTSAYIEGYNPFIDMINTALFNVIENQYNIVEFNIYNDEASFGNPNLEVTEFFRGEDMYIEFKVIDVDTNETIMNPDLFSSVTLYGNPNTNPERAFVDFDFIELTGDGYYHFGLDSIPLDDDYLGNSLVISYALSQGEDVGQLNRTVQIYNNEPVWEDIDPILVEISQTVFINLNNYVNDLEDSNLIINVEDDSDLVNLNLVNNMLSITGANIGNGEITISALDSDNGYTETNFNIVVGVFQGLNAYFTAPTIVKPEQGFTLDASASTGDIIEYCWDFGDGFVACTDVPDIEYNYDDRGSYNVTLMVIDVFGNEDTFSRIITVKRLGSCADGLDNDGDNLIDMDDPGCQESNGFSEFNLNTDLEKGLRFDYVDVVTTGYYVYPGEEVYINTKVRSKASEDIEDIKLIIMVPEFGIKIKSQKFDLDEEDTETVNMIVDVPYWAPAGEYVVKITASDGDIIHSTYRFFYVGN